MPRPAPSTQRSFRIPDDVHAAAVAALDDRETLTDVVVEALRARVRRAERARAQAAR